MTVAMTDTTNDGTKPTLRPRTRAPHTRRIALMDAAEQLFLTQGIHATRIEDITTAAQVAKGTFYIYFPSRDALLEALQQRFMSAFCQRIDAALAQCPHDHWPMKLRTWFETALDGLLGQIVRHDMLFQDIRPSRERELMADNPVITQLCELLQDGTDSHAWKTPQPRMMALMMFHAMHGLADEALAQGTVDQRVPLVDTLTNTFGKALTTD